MGFFDNKREQNTEEIRVNTRLGRAITSINSAKEELFEKQPRKDPVPFIEKAAKENLNFYGFFHTGENKGEPFFLPENETTMEIYVGSTGTGKGVLLGNRALEAIKKKKGVIIIDPKTDGFLPQICLEELTRQGRPQDFLVAAWPYNFGYDGINEEDDYIAVANKLTDAFGWEESDNPGVDYYRKKSRVMLKRVLKMFFNGDLGVIIKKDLNQIAKNIIKLASDLKKQQDLETELNKTKPNYDKIEELQKRYFNTDLLLKQHWDKQAVDTLESIAESFGELIEAGHIYKNFDLKGALYEGKVLYFRVDMLDISSLKMIKLMINDAIQQARIKKADTIIIADELSFYANQTIAGALATVRSMGLKFLLALQDLAQMKDEHIRNAILSNCNVKLFYKISDAKTLEYVEKIGGKELVTAYSTSAAGESVLTQKQEEYLNTTRIRALPRTETAIIVAEALYKPEIVRTNFVAVNKEFDWSKYQHPPKKSIFDNIISKDKDKDDDNFRFITKAKEAKELIKGSDLLAISFETDEIDSVFDDL